MDNFFVAATLDGGAVVGHHAAGSFDTFGVRGQVRCGDDRFAVADGKNRRVTRVG